jgi:predicted Zn-dependent protease
MSITYLCGTDWPAHGAVGFFEKIEAEGEVEIPQWLNTHPNPENRILNYHTWATEAGCAGKEKYEERYAEFKALF